MNIISRRLVFLCIVLLLPAFISFSQSTPWKLAKDQNGIKVYTRHLEGYEIDELRTELTVKAPLNAIVAVITNADDYSDWIYACSSSRILQRISETEQYQYQVNDLPYPFSDRDVAIHFKIWRDAATKKVFTSSIAEPTFIPLVDGLVRLPVFIGGYELTPNADGTVHIAYQLRLDPGGSIPDWMANMFIVKGPYESTMKLREMVESKKYDSVEFAFLN